MIGSECSLFSSYIECMCILLLRKKKKGHFIDEMWWYINEACEININNDSATKFQSKLRDGWFRGVYTTL